MERWRGKVAVVTGVSSGIGAATVRDLALAGVITIGLARRKERIVEIITGLPKEARTNLHAIKCDVSKELDIVNAFIEIEERFKRVDILVNNAGIMKMGMLIDAGNSNSIQSVVNTNVMGLIFCTREAVQLMRKQNIDGHIIHINSIVGHFVPMAATHPILSVYAATKHAVTAITETHRQEFIHMGTKIKVTSISPGLVDTEIIAGVIKNRGSPALESKDISDAILYVLGTPTHVQVHELIIKPIGEMC